MFNIGMGEIAVLAVLALLVFGPDRLPKAIQSITSGLRNLRSSATDATKSLQEAAGIDSETTRQTMDDIAQLHPKRLMGSVLDDVDGSPNGSSGKNGSATSSAPSQSLGDFDPDAP